MESPKRYIIGLYAFIKYSLLFTVLTIIITSLHAASAPEDTLKVRKVYDIEGVIIYGEFKGKTIGTVDVKDIDSKAVTTDTAIGNMIKDMPGVLLTERGKGESVVRFRGFEDRHIRVFIDGMPISDGYFGNYDLHLISANNVSNIHLIKGPVSHQYGFNTMGGILNIITDSFNEDNVLNARFLYSSHGRSQASINGSYGIGRSQLYLSTSYFNTPGFVLPAKLQTLARNSIEEGGERRINSSRDQYSISSRLITDIAGINTLTFTAGYSYMPHKGNAPSIYEHVDNRYSKIEDWSKISASISAKTHFLNNYELTASTYYDQSEDTYILFNNARYERELWSSLIRNNTLGFHLNTNHKGEYFNNDFGVRIEKKGYDRSGGPGYEGIWVDNNQSMMKFYHLLLFPAAGENYSLTVGNALSTFNHSQIDNYNWYWEPQAGLSYRFGTRTVSIAYGISNQFPTMRELFSSTSGNPQLKPENAHKLETTFTTPFAIAKSQGTLNMSLFHNRVKDLIRSDRMSFYNLENMTTYGAEAGLNWSFISKIIHDYGVSYLKLDEGNSTISLMEYPQWKLRFNHRLLLSERLNLDFSTVWYDNSLTYYREEEYFNLPSYWVQDVGLKYFFGRANLILNISNLLDAYYEPQYGYPAPGREITLALEIPLL